MKFLLAIALLAGITFAEEARILRYPNASKTHITFSHAGDIYTVPIGGGLARRITSDKGLEMFPRISPDGKTVAFQGQYDGNPEIYTIPLKGGSPKRITYSMDVGPLPNRMGPDKIIMQWTDNQNVLYRSRHEDWHAWTGKLFTQNIEGGMPVQIPVPVAGYGFLSPDGKKLVYNRVFREFRTWKRYRGGQADDVWIYDLKLGALENITNNKAQDIMPMWAENRVYYLSDRTGTLNIYSYDLTTKATKAITTFDKYDVKFPSMGSDYIAFENEGYIKLINLKTDEVTKVTIEINEDFPDARDEIKDLSKKVGNGAISPSGKRILAVARGNIFNVAAEKGRTKPLIVTSGVHERGVEWSPDGKWIAYISDESGEDEIYLIHPDGSGKIQLTKNAESYRFGLKWSPDSKKILTHSKSLKLEMIDVASKKVTQVRKSTHFEINEYDWSPDSRWVTFTDYVGNYWPIVYLYDTQDGKTTQVTSEFFQSSGGRFTPGGNYLLFTSDRTYNPSISSFEWNFQVNNMSKIYGITLKNDLESPFKYEEEVVEWQDKIDEEEESEEKKDDKVKVEIDLDGIQDRIFEVPVQAGNYFNLYPAKGHKLYYVKSLPGKGAHTYYYDFVKKKESKVGDFTTWGVSADESKMIVIKGGNWYVEDFGTKVDPSNKVDFSGVKFHLDKSEEWAQIYYEGWRQMKHFFYDPNMHGVDWDWIKKKYEVFLPHIHHRADLTYIMGEMIGELNVGHAYVGGGDMPKVDNVKIGLLGAEYKFENGGYKFKTIFEGRNWDEKTRSPLQILGADIKEGDYLISVDGQKLSKDISPFVALVGKADTWVEIEVASSPSGENSRIYNVETKSSEAGLRYFNWVEKNRKYVDEMSNGEIAYVHVPDMGVGNGLIEFIKYFYPQAQKKALIIDDRYNGGGNVSPMIIERLKRELTLAGNLRNQTAITGKPNATMTGPMVCLINELSASDGDLFPYQFKQNNLGPLIGKRSWGGVIGIRGSLPFLDGGYMMKPEFSHFSTSGEWILEGTGMTPDIEVDNKPMDVMNGKDAQLDKAIEVVKELMKKDNDTNRYPTTPPKYDDRSKKSIKN